VLCFSVQHLSVRFPILRSTERGTIKNVYRSSCNIPARHFFGKILKLHISWKSVQCEQSCFIRRDRHVEANIWFSQNCERLLTKTREWVLERGGITDRHASEAISRVFHCASWFCVHSDTLFYDTGYSVVITLNPKSDNRETQIKLETPTIVLFYGLCVVHLWM